MPVATAPLHAVEQKPAAEQKNTGEVLLTSSAIVEVFQVRGTERTPLGKDLLVVCKIQPNIFAKPKLIVKVGNIAWESFKEVHVMRSTSSSNEPTFIFSHADDPETFHCVIFPADAPAQEVQTLEGELLYYTTFHTSQIKKQGPFPPFLQLPQLPFQLPPPPQLPPMKLPDFSPHEMADNLRRGSEAAARAIISAAQSAGQAISDNAQNAKRTMPACTTPTRVDPELKENLERAKQATAASATIVGGVAAGVCAASKQVATSVVDTLAATGGTKQMMANKDNQQGKAVQEVGQAGIEAFTNVRIALEQAAYILWFHARGATIDVVNHSQGPEAAQAAATSLDIVQGIGDVAHAMQRMKTERVVASAMKEGASHLKDTPAAADGPRYPPGFNPALLNGYQHGAS